jgi:hypothetical protein
LLAPELVPALGQAFAVAAVFAAAVAASLVAELPVVEDLYELACVPPCPLMGIRSSSMLPLGA